MKVLSRWTTVGFAVIAFVVSRMIAGVAVRFMVPQDLDLHGRISNGTRVAVFSLVSTPILIITLILASRRSRSSVLAYLGLDIPRRKHVAITVAGLAVLIVVRVALQLALGWDMVEPWRLEIYRSTQGAGSLIWLWLAVVVVGPIGEELLFRGFMFRGLVRAPRDAIPNIVLISLIWSLIHTQYGWFVIAEIFVFGLVLGLVRWSTGSTTLTILLHMLNNLEGWIETGLVLG